MASVEIVSSGHRIKDSFHSDIDPNDEVAARILLNKRAKELGLTGAYIRIRDGKKPWQTHKNR